VQCDEENIRKHVKENLHTTSNALNANKKLIGNVSGYYIDKEVANLINPRDTLVATRLLNACEWVNIIQQHGQLWEKNIMQN
jgi:hypothetical protein